MKLFKFFKKNKNLKGGIEIITPSQISGWVYSKGNSFKEVVLICNEKIVSEAFINEKRDDVAVKLGLNNKYIGFKLDIPTELSINFNKINKLLVFAINKQSNKKIKLESISDVESIDYKLNYLLNNRNLLGIDGHIDGILDDYLIHGWCINKRDKNPQRIWLRCDSNSEAIPILCDTYREDLEAIGIHDKSGFEISSNDIPDSFKNKFLKFSYDEKGIFSIPQTSDIIFTQGDNNEMLVPIKESKLVNSQVVSDYSEYLNDPNSLFSEDWQNLHQYKLFLDILDEKLKQKNNSFLQKIKNSLFKKITN